MKLIDIGICIDNNDPRGMGRIRCVRYSEQVSEKERSMEYEPFSAEDPFICNSFLPLNINLVPKIGQAIKIINYDNEKLNVNQEYIAGPFINLIDVNKQTFTQQIENTTYGNTNKTRSDIFDKEGNYRNKKSDGFYHKKDDYGVYGKNGSDIIFTNNGVVIRGGKLMSDNKLSSKEKLKSIDQPFVYNKIPSFQIKKFPQKYKLEKKTTTGVTNVNKLVKYFIEYDIDTLINPSEVICKLVKITKDKPEYYSNTFSHNTKISIDDIQVIIEHKKNVTNLKNASIEINNFIYKIFKGSKINDVIGSEYIVDFPLYFKPKYELVTTTNVLKTQLTDNVNFFNIGPMSGLIWDKNRITQTGEQNTQEVDVLIPDSEQDESISSLISDRLYLLSTDPNESERNVDFSQLNNYEIDQETYMKQVEPNTYSMVRGENLIRVLKTIISVVLTHEHNVVGPMVQNENYEQYTDLMERLKNLETEILNNKIKIN